MRRALGKGLSQLIGEQQADTRPYEVEISAIVRNERQPRIVFEETALQELADSIREKGVLSPILVRPLSDGKYELIAGERRWRASQMAGLERVPVIVRAAGTQEALELALIENIQREDISAMECAKAFQQLGESYGLTQEQIAQKVGKSRVAVANTLRLLRLPSDVQQALESGAISEGHARALLMLDTPALQSAGLRRVVAKGLSVRDTEKLASRNVPKPREESSKTTKRSAQSEHPDDQALAEAIGIFLGSPTRLERSEAGGRLVIEFYSDEDLQRVLDVLGMHL